jgi:hypothetical protein
VSAPASVGSPESVLGRWSREEARGATAGCEEAGPIECSSGSGSVLRSAEEEDW